MRERTRLDQAISGYRTVEQDYNDTVELIELGEAEDDQEVVEDAGKALTRLHKRTARMELESLLSRRGRRQ